MELNFKLSLEVTNTIMGILAEQPYKTVAPILADMQMQANAQMKPQLVPAPGVVPAEEGHA